MTKIRRLARIIGEWHAIKVDLEGVQKLLSNTFKQYKAAIPHTKKWREDHVDELDRVRAEKKNIPQRKEKQQRKEIERMRNLSQKVKGLRNKSHNLVTKRFFTEEGIRTGCTTKDTMEHACITENKL
jgi:hypothetical protein